MNWRKTATAAITIAFASAATATCEAIVSNFDFNFHLEIGRPHISRTWDIDQPIPDEIYKELSRK